MSQRQLHILLALYPSGWRRRHGPEVEQLISDLAQEGDRSQLGLAVDLVHGAVGERLPFSPALGFALAVVAVSGVMGGVVVTNGASSRRATLPAHVEVHRDHSGRITEVLGSPVKIVMNPKTHKVVSITPKGSH